MAVDWLSRGRLFPAVGVGVELPREFDASGVPFKERGRRTDEAIRVMRLLWTQDEVTFQGEFFKLDRVTIFPKPWQNPPPIWIGGKSEAAQKRTARLGDGWIPSFITRGVRVGVRRCRSSRRLRAGGFPGPLRDPHQLTVAQSEAEALALAQPYIPRARVDETTMRACTAFGPSVLASRIEVRQGRARSSSCARSARPSACSASSPQHRARHRVSPR
jgi:alkanesulfonate monooxygenase SsuD/methylene tetrahydromethanopterin reductase-like flavin-dependent oxidoreductase (luciferase family)